MKVIKNIFIVVGLLVAVSGCDYLDSEPEKKGTLEEAFASVNSARNFLYACYSFMPESSDHNGEPQFGGASDEVCMTSQWATTWHYSKVVNIGCLDCGAPMVEVWK